MMHCNVIYSKFWPILLYAHALGPRNGDVVGGVEGVAGVVAAKVVGDDQQILKQHEIALQRLEELQGDMIGGEKGGESGLSSLT